MHIYGRKLRQRAAISSTMSIRTWIMVSPPATGGELTSVGSVREDASAAKQDVRDAGRSNRSSKKGTAPFRPDGDDEEIEVEVKRL